MIYETINKMDSYDRIINKCLYNTDKLCAHNNTDDWYYNADNNCVSSNSVPKEPIYYDTELYIRNIFQNRYLDSCGGIPTVNLSK